MDSDLELLAADASADLSAAELHGVVCGMVAADISGFSLDSLIALIGEESVFDQDSVRTFVEASVPDLLADDMRFQLLLPEDDAPLVDRSQAVAEWCGSFASGFAACSGELSDAPEEVGEILRDMVAISQLDIDDDDADAEKDLFELIEFARVGAMLLLASMNGGGVEGGE